MARAATRVAACDVSSPAYKRSALHGGRRHLSIPSSVVGGVAAGASLRVLFWSTAPQASRWWRDITATRRAAGALLFGAPSAACGALALSFNVSGA